MRPPVVPRAATLLVLVVVALCAGACGASVAAPTQAAPSDTGSGAYPGWPIGPESGVAVVPLLINQQLAVGSNRFLFTLYDAADETKVVAAPDVTTSLAFYDLAKDPATPVATVPGTFIWAVSTPPDPRGLYHATVSFGEAGDWGVQITVQRPGQPVSTSRVQFSVLPTTTTPAIGAPAPSVVTPTATTAAGIALISTDQTPDPAFYRTSEADALAQHQPFVLVFATPQFCQSQICGPTLDMVNAVAVPFESKVVFIHVEPYVLQPATGGGLQPVLDASGQLQLVPAAVKWGLPDEPWVFVVDASGKVTAKFEGAVGADELTQAIQAVAGG